VIIINCVIHRIFVAGECCKLVDISVLFYSSLELLVFSKRDLWPKWCLSHWVIWKFYKSKLPQQLPKQHNLSMDHYCSRRQQSEADLPLIRLGDLFYFLLLHMWPRWDQRWKRWKLHWAKGILWWQNSRSNSSYLFWAIHVDRVQIWFRNWKNWV